MSKRAYESGSSKRNKATAETEALRVVIEKTKPITQFFSVSEGPTPEVATHPGCRSRLRQDSAFSFEPGAGVKNL